MLDTSTLKQTFNEDFNSLRLQQQGVWDGWNAAYSWDKYNTLSAHTIFGESAIYVDPTFAGSGSSALGINPFSVSGGVLSISATKTPDWAKGSLWNYNYTSGLLTTEGTFSQTYGYFEMRADLPDGKGSFPAFWLLSEDGNYSEIDIMEVVNGDDMLWNHIHYSPSPGAARIGSGFYSFVDDVSAGFHTYGVLWAPDKITWYVDGNAVNSVATPSIMNSPMYMLVNYAVGGAWAGAPDGSPLTDMKVDYIRAYSLENAPASVTNPVVGPKTSLSITANNASQNEGTGGTTYSLFTVSRSGDLTKGSTANWSVTGSGSSPADASDFGGTTPGGTVYFGVGETAKTIWVPVSGDSASEANEGFTVTLSGASGGTIVSGSASSVIANDDGGYVAPAPSTPAPTTPAPSTPTGVGLSVSANSAIVTEGAAGTGYALFTVTRSGDLSKGASANWSVAGGGSSPATAADFGGTLPTGTVYFGSGENSKTIWVPVSGDLVAEADETFTLTLGGANGASIVNGSASVVIANDDGAYAAPSTPAPTTPAPSTPAPTTPTGVGISVGPSNSTIIEGAAGTIYATFTVTRDGDLSKGATANWTVAGSGSSPADAADFGGAFPGGTVYFGSGENAKTIWVPVSGDRTAEANETFTLTLSGPTGGAIVNGTATVTITNDDGTPAVSAPVESTPATTTNATAGVDYFQGTAARDVFIVDSGGVDHILNFGVGQDVLKAQSLGVVNSNASAVTKMIDASASWNGVTGAEVIRWVGAVGEMDSAQEVDGVLMAMPGQPRGGVFVAAYSPDQKVAIYYDAHADQYGGTQLVAVIDNLTSTSALNASSFEIW